MFITPAQVLCHFIGDYLLQSHWMAEKKSQRNIASWAHGVTYGLPFVFLQPDWHTFAIIVVSHWIIDSFRLARFVIYAKNFIAPRLTLEKFDVPPIHIEGPLPDEPASFQFRKRYWWHPWKECNVTGYHKDVPEWLATWLYLIVDNLMHVICNGLAFWLEQFISW